MDVLDAIKQRRSVRFFKDNDEISKEETKLILEAAKWAPSTHNLQPIEYIVLHDKSVKKAVTAACNQNQPMKAPLAIVILGNMHLAAKLSEVTTHATSTAYRGTHMLVHMDAAAAIQNMLLVATSLGIDSLWIGSFVDHKIHEVLELPEHLVPLAILCFGHRSRPPFNPHKRPIEERLYSDRYKLKHQDMSYLEECRLINSEFGEYAGVTRI